MAEYRHAAQAEADVEEIATYTLRTWGVAQAARYLDAMEACFVALATRPDLGRPCPEIAPGLHRCTQGSHVVFYRLAPYGIRIVRILHGRQLPKRHRFEGE